MKTNLIYFTVAFALFLAYSCTAIFGSGDDDLTDYADPPLPKSESEWVYATLEYRHDVIAPNLYFMELLIHPDNPDAKMIDGYVSQDGHAFVKLRGVDVPRALHHVSQRHRPHVWRERERQNWDKAMQYVWNLTDPTHTFRLHNLNVIENEGFPTLTVKHVIEADAQFFLGGAWHNLAIAMMADSHSRPLQADGTRWDAGDKEYSLENPNNPR